MGKLERGSPTVLGEVFFCPSFIVFPFLVGSSEWFIKEGTLDTRCLSRPVIQLCQLRIFPRYVLFQMFIYSA